MTSSQSAALDITLMWITGAVALTALMMWIGYLITRTAVKNGMIRAHEELDRRALEREREREREEASQSRPPRLREPDFRANL
ncbi:hypothetical protein [Microbacterium sp. NPDC087868]|uniref:hypothetical protein n=1 Tax=Microbacterium sp. NPDC087868 TaxID=3364195 RepID=UPI00384FAC43